MTDLFFLRLRSALSSSPSFSTLRFSISLTELDCMVRELDPMPLEPPALLLAAPDGAELLPEDE